MFSPTWPTSICRPDWLNLQVDKLTELWLAGQLKWFAGQQPDWLVASQSIRTQFRPLWGPLWGPLLGPLLGPLFYCSIIQLQAKIGSNLLTIYTFISNINCLVQNVPLLAEHWTRFRPSLGCRLTIWLWWVAGQQFDWQWVAGQHFGCTWLAWLTTNYFLGRWTHCKRN